jgi:hypothetical protein
MRDRFTAFVPHADVVIQGATTGPLAGLTFWGQGLVRCSRHRHRGRQSRPGIDPCLGPAAISDSAHALASDVVQSEAAFTV